MGFSEFLFYLFLLNVCKVGVFVVSLRFLWCLLVRSKEFILEYA